MLGSLGVRRVRLGTRRTSFIVQGLEEEVEAVLAVAEEEGWVVVQEEGWVVVQEEGLVLVLVPVPVVEPEEGLEEAVVEDLAAEVELVEDQGLEEEPGLVVVPVLVADLEEVVVEGLEAAVAVDSAVVPVEDLVVELELELVVDFHENINIVTLSI